MRRHLIVVGKKKNAIKPLDKVEISDLGTFPLPVGAFCSSHWFDYRPGGLVATGFYGGGTQIPVAQTQVTPGRRGASVPSL